MTPKHNKTRFFLLDSKHEQPQKVGTYNGTITLVSVAVPHYLKRPQIVTRSNKNELESAEFHQWAIICCRWWYDKSNRYASTRANAKA